MIIRKDKVSIIGVKRAAIYLQEKKMRSYHICYGSFLVITFLVTLLVSLEAVNAAMPIDIIPSDSNNILSNGGFERGNFSGWEVWGDPNNCSEDTICQPVWCDVLTNETCIVRSMSLDITNDSFTDKYSAVLGHYNKDSYTYLYSKIDLRQNLNLTRENTNLSLYTKVFSENIGVNQGFYNYFIIVNDGTEHIIWSLSDTNYSSAFLNNWTLLTFNLSEYSGKNITLIFRFMQDFCCGNGKQWDLIWSGTSLWYLDDIKITTTTLGRVRNINKSTVYLTIQAAIDDASPGDEIYVNSGIYYENVNVNKQLILKGINTGAGNPVVDARGNGNAITLSSGNSTLEGFEVLGSCWPDAGIFVSSNDNLIRNNNVSNNYKGIFLDESSHNNTLISNNVSNNGIFGIFLDSSRNNTLRDNSVTNSNSYGLYLGDSPDNTIDGNYISNNLWTGIYLDYSSNNNILNGNNITNNNGDGISILGSMNNILMVNNVLNNNGFGISLWGSNSIMLTRNNVLNNSRAGIYLRGSLSNTLDNNRVLNNTGEGISLWYHSDNNTLKGNIVSNNLDDGIFLGDSNNNIVYNNFFNNINNYKILNSLNKWNITKINNTNIILGLYMGGNIWANPNGTGFSQTCEDNDGDGICDSTFMFDNNSDYLPLAYFLDQALSPSFSVSPSNVLPDQLFNIELIINNNHFETINDVKPLLLIGTLDGNASARMISGPVPGSADILGRSSQIYTWTYRASGIGTLELSGSASGVDVVSGKTATSIFIYKNISVVLREGGVSISVLPRSTTVLNGTSIILDIKAKNTQNVDDVFKIQIIVNELPLLYQADPGWFNWTDQIVYLKAGQEMITPINITIPDTISGTKMFRAKVSQETSGIYAYDTGYLKII